MSTRSLRNIRDAQRRGTSLLETMAVVAVMGVALSILSVSWHLLTRIHRRTDQAIQETRQVERLAFRFRLDMRETVAVQAAAVGTPDQETKEISPHQSWDLRLRDGRVVEYRHATGGIERRLKRDEQIEHRDLYRLPDWAEVQMQSPEPQRQNPARLSFYRNRTGLEDASRTGDASQRRQPWLVVQSPIEEEGAAP